MYIRASFFRSAEGLLIYSFTSACDSFASRKSTSKSVSDRTTPNQRVPVGRMSLLPQSSCLQSVVGGGHSGPHQTSFCLPFPLPFPLLPSPLPRPQPFPLLESLDVVRLDLPEGELECIIHWAITCTARLGSMLACLLAAVCEVHAWSGVATEHILYAAIVMLYERTF